MVGVALHPAAFQAAYRASRPEVDREVMASLRAVREVQAGAHLLSVVRRKVGEVDHRVLVASDPDLIAAGVAGAAVELVAASTPWAELDCRFVS